MGSFTMFKCGKADNMLIEVMYERRLKPLEVIFNLKFDVRVTDTGQMCGDEFFYKHLKSKFSGFSIENELQSMDWPEGWSFRPYNTRYTYEHTWEAIRQRSKPSHLGIDVVLTAPERLRNDRQQIKKESFAVADRIAKMVCFQPTQFVDFGSRLPRVRKKDARKNLQNSSKSEQVIPAKKSERRASRKNGKTQEM